MRRMGSKTGAARCVSAAGVPVVPGAYAGIAGATPTSPRPSTAIGFPALLKAAAGGGGKGMRIVRAGDESAEAIAGARGEAERAFGNGDAVRRAADRAGATHRSADLRRPHGHVVHLFERDCTLQRRHQKVIEEAPAPTLTPAVRERLTRAAVAAARAVGYVNAGTFEFLLEGDGDEAQFYFLEMNTRLQVEHPVTEAVTGLDLVRAQILVASRRAAALPAARHFARRPRDRVPRLRRRLAASAAAGRAAASLSRAAGARGPRRRRRRRRTDHHGPLRSAAREAHRARRNASGGDRPAARGDSFATRFSVAAQPRVSPDVLERGGRAHESGAHAIHRGAPGRARGRSAR